MKRGMLITLLLLLLPGWTASGQQSEGMRISIQGGQVVQGARGKKEQATQLLSNESIVKLVKAGLGEDTIISMVNTQPGTYLLGADDIIALKQAGVSGGFAFLTSYLDCSLSLVSALSPMGRVQRPRFAHCSCLRTKAQSIFFHQQEFLARGVAIGTPIRWVLL